MSLDNPLITKLGLLTDCLCAQIEADGLPATCVCGLIPGEGASLDYAGDCTEACGSAWVRLIGAAPSTGVGIIDESLNNCSGGLGFEVEVGVARCLAVMDDDGNPAPPEALLEATVLQIADMYAMRTAIACCDGLGDFVIGAYVPFGPEGGVVGGTWSVTISEEV